MMPFRELIEPIASSRTLGYVFLMALGVGLYAVIPTAIEYSAYADVVNTSSQFHAVLSLVLGWLLVFRTNTAYSRWWEARTLWGALVNACRNCALKVTCLGRFTEHDRHVIRDLIGAFPVALRCHLRGEIGTHLPDGVRKLAGTARHVPQAIAQHIYQIVGKAKQDGAIDGDELRVLDAELLRLMDICGGCERILKTRIVKSYRIFARQCVLIFLGTLPWGIVQDFRIWTIPLTIITAYFMLGMETVAEHVEEPFGYDEDDLDLDSLCNTIATTVDEAMARRAS